jgi:hypothetical protein
MMATINKILKRLRPRRKQAFVYSSGYTSSLSSYVITSPSVTTNMATAWTSGFQTPTGATGVQGSQSHGDPTGPQGPDDCYVRVRDEVELPSLPLSGPLEPELPDGMVGLCWEEELPMVIASFPEFGLCRVRVATTATTELFVVPFGTVWVDREVPA